MDVLTQELRLQFCVLWRRTAFQLRAPRTGIPANPVFSEVGLLLYLEVDSAQTYDPKISGWTLDGRNAAGSSAIGNRPRKRRFWLVEKPRLGGLEVLSGFDI